jgi:hypothetical protein
MQGQTAASMVVGFSEAAIKICFEWHQLALESDIDVNKAFEFITKIRVTTHYIYTVGKSM